ncbi:CoA-binding protein [uncultured Croceitalea sp.]|uniref:CoA-binding protein n=1 Tax=uncultured Croceitalea sp. TaxID=1798908 RepID=UPI003305B91B
MKTTLVFGASLKPNRYSNIAIHRLLENNIKTFAFGLRTGKVSTVQIKTNLNNFENINTITLYMNPTRQSEYYHQIIDLAPKRVIFNPGTENPEFYKLLQEKGIVVEVACTLVLLATGQY